MISKNDIKKLAKLARIAISDAEVESIAKDAEAILGYVFDVGVERGAREGHSHTALLNVMRDDAAPHESGIYTKRLLQAAPKHLGGHIAVRKVIAKTGKEQARKP